MSDRGTRLATRFAELARALLSEDDLDRILGRIAAVAVAEVDGCESAGIDLIENRVVRCVAWSSETARRLGEIQIEVGEGPFQADSSSPGVGLGLFVSRGLARAHGGNISVRPAKHQGSEFVLELPVA